MPEENNLAANLDEQLTTRQPWCTCKNPYYCNGEELLRVEKEPDGFINCLFTELYDTVMSTIREIKAVPFEILVQILLDKNVGTEEEIKNAIYETVGIGILRVADKDTKTLVINE